MINFDVNNRFDESATKTLRPSIWVKPGIQTSLLISADMALGVRSLAKYSGKPRKSLIYSNSDAYCP